MANNQPKPVPQNSLRKRDSIISKISRQSQKPSAIVYQDDTNKQPPSVLLTASLSSQNSPATTPIDKLSKSYSFRATQSFLLNQGFSTRPLSDTSSKRPAILTPIPSAIVHKDDSSETCSPMGSETNRISGVFRPACGNTNITWPLKPSVEWQADTERKKEKAPDKLVDDIMQKAKERIQRGENIQDVEAVILGLSRSILTEAQPSQHEPFAGIAPRQSHGRRRNMASALAEEKTLRSKSPADKSCAVCKSAHSFLVPAFTNNLFEIGVCVSQDTWAEVKKYRDQVLIKDAQGDFASAMSFYLVGGKLMPFSIKVHLVSLESDRATEFTRDGRVMKRKRTVWVCLNKQSELQWNNVRKACLAGRNISCELSDAGGKWRQPTELIRLDDDREGTHMRSSWDLGRKSLSKVNSMFAKLKGDGSVLDQMAQRVDLSFCIDGWDESKHLRQKVKEIQKHFKRLQESTYVGRKEEDMAQGITDGGEVYDEAPTASVVPSSDATSHKLLPEENILLSKIKKLEALN